TACFYLYYIYCLVVIITLSFFFFTDTATTEIYTLSLHDALPIYLGCLLERGAHRSAPFPIWIEPDWKFDGFVHHSAGAIVRFLRSEEHTSELQSRFDLVCRLLLEKKNTSNSIQFMP